ncbi:MAG: InlB B-repeat-containing protein, partial [Bacteroidales bacterium]|nr:InlB B-repeat-containing protein [Bacteroidales bacterium]
YGFYGWYREPLCTNLWNFETATVQNNLTLYAKWGEPSAVQDLLDAEQSESLKAWVQNGALHISGLIINQPFEIYTITGIPVYRGVVTSDVEAISCGSLPHGIYIIHQSNRSLKLNL